MAIDHIKSAALPRALSEVLADVADLVQKEIRLARAELSSKLTTKVQGGVWLAAAGVMGFVALLVLADAIALGIATTGLALGWSYLIVAVLFGAIAGAAFLKGRSDMSSDMTPERTIRSVQDDITAVKEQVT